MISKTAWKDSFQLTLRFQTWIDCRLCDNFVKMNKIVNIFKMPPAFLFFFSSYFWERYIPYLKRITILRNHKIYFCIRKSYAKKFFTVMPDDPKNCTSIFYKKQVIKYVLNALGVSFKWTLLKITPPDFLANLGLSFNIPSGIIKAH